MKKIFHTKFLILVLLIFLFFPLFPTTKAQSEKINIRVGVYDNSPKIWVENNGEVKGLWADIVNYIGAQEGWDIQYIKGSWDECLERLERNEIDIMVDVAFSGERAELYDFSKETVFINWASVYTAQNVDINSFADLEGKDIAVMKSGIHYNGPTGIKNLMDSFELEANYVDVKEYDEVFKLLDEKKVQVGIVNRIFGVVNEQNYDVRRTSIVFNPTELRFALTKNAPDNSDLIEKLDKNIKQLKEDPNSIYYDSIKKYLKGVTVIEEVEVTPQWVIYSALAGVVIAIALLVVALISNRYQNRLKKTVETITKQLQNSEKKYRNLIQEAPISFAITNPSGTIIDVNSKFLNDFRYDLKKDLLGASVETLYNNPKDRDKYLKAMEKRGLHTFDFQFKRSDGTIFRGLLTSTKYTNEEGKEEFVSVIENISNIIK